MKRTYLAIDLKSFYASVECVIRGLDPLNTNLVVADESRTEKTICLAVSPSLKSFGISGRARLFEVIQRVEQVNKERLGSLHGGEFRGSSHFDSELRADAALKLDYIVARPQMALYQKFSTDIFKVYLKYVSAGDIHVYSIDEVFIDVSGYLAAYHGSAHEMAVTMIRDVLATTGITATAGIGTNLYLCKIAMDIVAKHMPADKDGVRIAELDEVSYRRLLWSHRPLTDFWRVGSGYARKLEKNGLFTMGDVAQFSLSKYGEEKLYKLFGVNAELLIDHAWGYEPCTIADVKSFKPETNSISMGQVLQCAADNETARLIIWEMADMLALDLVAKGIVTDQIVLTVGYDIKNLRDPAIREYYKGDVKRDHYGRSIPKHAHGTINLDLRTASARRITAAAMELFDRITDKKLFIRRMYIVACDVRYEEDIRQEQQFEQLSFFTDNTLVQKQREAERLILTRERSIQRAMLEIKRRYGKNAILRGANYQQGATAIQRNGQIGGHRA